ncbi:MAG TPA: hypothetical protein VKQ11_09510 [Candidatus Sulfotelmatobacter sp.]|nr:hypothetical protein [Candidatus Sulfotelmatobacter sp.]
MRLRLLFTFCFIHRCLAAGQDAPKAHVRFFNDSAKAVNFYVDNKVSCSVPANPEENNAYCDSEVSTGKHKLSVRGPKLALQSCELFIGERGAEANLSKGERFRCFAFLRGD